MKRLDKRLEALERLIKASAPAANLDLRQHIIPVARPLVDDKSRWKAAIGTRRCAKSYTAALYLLHEAFTRKTNVLYCGLEHSRIKQDFWRACLLDVDARYGLDLKLNDSELTAQTPNGSWITCLSIDADERQKRKIRGGKYSLIIIDECQSFCTDLASLVNDVLQASTADYHGTIVLLGTPGTLQEGFWYDVIHGASGWKVFHWSASDNPHIEWDKDLEQLKKRTPGIELTTSFRREFLGEWVIDQSDLLYHFDPDKNTIDNLPVYVGGKWHHLLGIDLGFDHPTALVVAAYHDCDPCLYVPEVDYGTNWTVTDTANHIKQLHKRYRFERQLVDPAWAQTIQELRSRHNLELTAADKPGRDQMIELLNDQMILGRVKMKTATCQPLIHELRTVQKKAKVGDDLSDALRYVSKECYNYLAKDMTATVANTIVGRSKMEEDKMWQTIMREQQQKNLRDQGLLPPEREW